MRTLKETYMDVICMGSRKRQDLLSKLGGWGLWKRVVEEGRGREKKKGEDIIYIIHDLSLIFV